MKLARFVGKLSNFMVVRDLTEDELAKHNGYTPILTEARERLKLFRILSHNYRDWKRYVDSLLSVGSERHDDEMLQLDRLLLNYLTARTQLASISRFRFNSDSARTKPDKRSIAIFLMDFVQHHGSSRSFSIFGVTCSIADWVSDSTTAKPQRLLLQ